MLPCPTALVLLDKLPLHTLLAAIDHAEMDLPCARMLYSKAKASSPWLHLDLQSFHLQGVLATFWQVSLSTSPACF